MFVGHHGVSFAAKRRARAVRGGMRHTFLRSLAVLVGVTMLVIGRRVAAQASTSIRDAVIGEPGQPTAEISTEELARALADSNATVFDARPHAEYAISHIPGAQNVAPKPSVASAQSRPPWLWMMDRLIERPIPVPSGLVV